MLASVALIVVTACAPPAPTPPTPAAAKPALYPVLGKYLHNEDKRALGVTYDFFVGNVTPQYPVVDPALFGDAVEQLAATNDKIKSFDLNSILDNSFVQSAMDRHVGAP